MERDAVAAPRSRGQSLYYKENVKPRSYSEVFSVTRLNS